MTNTKSKKKTAKQKHVLGLAMVLAVIIAVGSTFAWFTSTDTVTNKLSASGDYAVYITETFTPTEDLTPGTQVNKDVSVVNAGNVDAFVRVSLDNTLELTTVDSTGEAFSDSNVADYITMTADEAMAMSAGGFLAYYSGSGTVTTGAVGSDYTPTASGYYIFRREITAGDPTTYEYVGVLLCL